ncbi:MAG: hypothetical protein LC640_08970 [Frankia sp.]|nr:hypothetical protein [Frankia sp.]
MTAAEAKAHQALLDDLLGIVRRNRSSISSRYYDIEDRIFEGQRQIKAARAACDCGEASCKSGHSGPGWSR